MTYSYEELFRTHASCDILITDADASVWNVTGGPPDVYNSTFIITNEELQPERFSLAESICSEANLKFGKCEAGSVSFDIINDPENPIASLKDKRIAVYLYFDGDSNSLFKVGIYTVESDVQSIDGLSRSIQAHDDLFYIRELDVKGWYDSLFPDNETEKTIKQVRDSLFGHLTGLGYCSQETTSLVNDSFMVHRTIESEAVLAGQVLEAICELNGVFGHNDRYGQFRYITLPAMDAVPSATIDDDYRAATETHEDYDVYSIRIARAYDQFGMQISGAGSSPVSVSHPSVYNIADNVFLADRNGEEDFEDIQEILLNFLGNIKNRRYKPIEFSVMADLCLEVGDRISVGGYETYILQRNVNGIQLMMDSITAQGDLRQPPYDGEPNFSGYDQKWHASDGTSKGKTTRTGSGRGTGDYTDLSLQSFAETIRNIGFRLLDEPEAEAVLNDDNSVEITWTDPADINTDEPVPAEWAGTVLVRKEGSAPLHIWDGDILVTSTTRDEYSTSGYVDATLEANKTYYYGIYPYSQNLDDVGLPIYHYTFTRIISVNTTELIYAPEITGTSVDGGDVALTYSIPDLDTGSYSYCKMLAKKNAIPSGISDADRSVDISSSGSTVTISGLNQLSDYYFMIITETESGTKAESDPVRVKTQRVTKRTLFRYDAAIGNSDTVSGKTFGGAFTFNSVDDYFEVGRNSAYIPYPQSHMGYSVTLGSGIITAKMKLYIDSSQLGTATGFASLIFTTENNDYLSFGISRQGGTTYVDRFVMMVSQYSTITARGEDDILFPRDQWFDIKFVVTYETDGTIPHIDFYVDDVKVAEFDSEYTYGPDPSTVFTQLRLASDSNRASYSTRKVVKMRSIELEVEYQE